MDTYRGHRRVEHGGNIDGFSANVILFPKDDVGMVVLTNLNGTPLPELIAQVAADRLLKLSTIDWITQGAARRAAVESAGREGEKKKEVTRVQGTQPSHKLEDYAGDYEHPGYGVLTIWENGGKLNATFNGLSSALRHYHFDVFEASEGAMGRTKFNFGLNTKGEIDRVSVPLQSGVSDIVFTRKPKPPQQTAGSN